MVARTEDRKFGTFALTEAANGIIIERWSNREMMKLLTRPRHSGTGSLRQKINLDGVTIRLEGSVRGTDTTGLKDNFDAFRAALQSGPDYLKLYSDRRILCELSRDLRSSVVSGPAGRAWRWQAEFMALVPSWESTTLFSDAFVRSGAGPYTTVLTSDTGDADAWPSITLIDTGGGWSTKEVTIANANTGRQFKMAGLSLQDGDSIVVDMLEGTIGDGAGTPVSPGVISGAPFPLTPGVATTLEFTHTIGAGAGIDINVAWRSQYLFL